MTGKIQPDAPTHNDIRQGFVYERAPHITLKSIANNAEIDVIWEKWQATLEPLRAELNAALGKTWEEWEIPREADADAGPTTSSRLHAAWWEARIARQKEIDASIAARADVEFLYDRPYEDKSRVRVAGPFTVESLSPHRVVPADEEELIAEPTRAAADAAKPTTPPADFAAMVLDHLRTAGVHQTPEGRQHPLHQPATLAGRVYRRRRPLPGRRDRAPRRHPDRPGIRHRLPQDLVAAAREAVEARFDVLIACAFNFDAHASELANLGPLPILKARMNPDLHMADELKNTGKGNLFVVFGEPDMIVEPVPDQPDHVRIRINGVDVFDPTPATSAPTTRRASPPGSSTPTTTRRASSSATPISSAPTIPTNPEDRAAGRDRRGRLGDALPRHLPPVPPAGDRADRGEGHQPLRRRGDEGVQFMMIRHPAGRPP